MVLVFLGITTSYVLADIQGNLLKLGAILLSEVRPDRISGLQF